MLITREAKEGNVQMLPRHLLPFSTLPRIFRIRTRRRLILANGGNMILRPRYLGNEFRVVGYTRVSRDHS